MGDFYQGGLVTTLHNFRTSKLETIENKLLALSKKRPISLILPCLYSELKGPALANIVEQLTKVKYINEIIIGLDNAESSEFRHAIEYFSKLPQHHRIIWNDSPRLKELEKKLFSKGIAPETKGKGTNVWYCFGYFIASNKSESVALHDCDILTFSRMMLARLIYPVTDPNFNYRFCKGYYYRADDNVLKGRVTRLLVTPLIWSLRKFFPEDTFLQYIDSFRYPLAGEFSMRADVVKNIRIPSDWGLEVGILIDVQRNNAVSRICQVDIADRFDHKHQELSKDKTNGIAKMSLDISRTIFNKLASNGHTFTRDMFLSIHSTYFRIAQDFVERYQSDAVINGLSIDRHSEEEAIKLFADMIKEAGERFLSDPTHKDSLPSWKRVNSAIPSFLKEMQNAVELDNAGEN